MVWAVSIIVVLIGVGTGIIFYLNRQMLLADIQRILNQSYRLLKSAHDFSQNNGLILNNECQEIRSLIIAIEQGLASPPRNKELNNFSQEVDNLYQELVNKIKDKQQQWAIYVDFKENLPYLIININQKKEEVVHKAEQLIGSNPEQKDLINEKGENTIAALDRVASEYQTLDRANFYEFNFYILEDLEREYLDALEGADYFLKELAIFNSRLRVYLSSVFRKGTFYLTLEEYGEGKRGKKATKDILVSYKTFNEANVGKGYDRDYVVGKKRVIYGQSITIEILIDEKKFSKTQELSNEEFKELFKELNLKVKGEKDQDDLPIEVNEKNISLLLCQKEEKSFQVQQTTLFFQSFNIEKIIDEALVAQNNK